MRLVRLKLRDAIPYWILHPIVLQRGSEMSPLINIDQLAPEQQKMIDQSIRAHHIRLFDEDGNAIHGFLDDVKKSCGNIINVEDVEEEEDVLPDIISVTVDEEEEIEEIVEEDPVDEQKFIEEAKLLLDKNGNTVKKVLRTLPGSDENLHLLHACLELESKNKNRQGILHAIQKLIQES